jgi:hypothetical protein
MAGKVKSLILAFVAVSVTFALTSAMPDASAHGSFKIIAGNGANANKTMSFVLGETVEPAFVNEQHNMELFISDSLTSLRMVNGHRSQTNPATQILFGDAYFYPKSALTLGTGGVPHMTGCTAASVVSGIQTGKADNCTPASGWTDSRTSQNVNSVFGKTGEYTLAKRQLYTQYGRTLYHIYGNVNYFNDTGVGLTPINFWTDGKDIKLGSAGTNNQTIVWSSGFGLNDVTADYWPGTLAGVTNATYPDNTRGALGKQGDIWDFLKSLAAAINSIPGITVPAVAP